MLASFRVQLFGSLAVHENFVTTFCITAAHKRVPTLSALLIDQVKDKTCCLNSHYITMSENIIQS